MAELAQNAARKLTRAQASAAVSGLGWRYMATGVAYAYVRVSSVMQAADVARRVAAAAGDDAGEHLRMDIRGDRLVLSVQSLATGSVLARDVELADQISAIVTGLGLATEPGLGGGTSRSVQVLEIAIDALDITAIRPFWKAVLGYQDEAGSSGPEDGIADPVAAGPTIWFQQMDVPRPERNRIHFDISVPHDEAERRIQAALAAGGALVSDAEAPAFWLLADPEGNEACILTWQGRDG